MIDHRRMQRTLLRMQLDRHFAAALLARDAAAVASTGLGERELALFAAADPRSFGADRDGARRAQLSGNITSEFALSLAGGEASDLAAGFFGSPEFHRAVADGARTVTAFAAYAARIAALGRHARLAALAALEGEMAAARRALREVPVPGEGEVVLAAHARSCVLPAGTFDLAAEVREALDAGRGIDLADLAASEPGPPGATETVLLLSRSLGRHRLREVLVERLEPRVALLLARCEAPFGGQELAAFAAELEVAPEDILDFTASLAQEGVLVRG